MKKNLLFFVSLTLILCFISLCKYSNIYKQETMLVSSNTTIKKTAYLTFDDGPSENTKKILNILDRYNISATFFVIGPSYKFKNDLLKDIINKGHSIAIHSYTHEYNKIYATKDSYINDFYTCLRWIKEMTNISPNIYRFPGGSSNTITSKENIQNIIKELYKENFFHVDWNVDSFDSHYNNDHNTIIKSTLKTIKINENNNIYDQIILMHDNTKKVATIEALPIIIEKCLSMGYKFETINSNTKLIQHVKKPK